jgi:hypothetical protein
MGIPGTIPFEGIGVRSRDGRKVAAGPGDELSVVSDVSVVVPGCAWSSSYHGDV